jgi:hypothetical protein
MQSETPTQAHNRIAKETFVAMAKAVDGAGGDDAALMVVLQSVILGGLLLVEQMYGVSRPVTIERLEEMSEHIRERLAAHTTTGGVA